MDIERYQAAGGIVFDDGKILLLRKIKENVVVLPKGHIDPGETPEQTAIRETIEETGYSHPTILADLGMLQSQYPREDKWYIRDEFYFVMTLKDHERGPIGDYDDVEHDKITFELFWSPMAEAEGLMSFEPAKTFVHRAVDWWEGRSQ